MMLLRSVLAASLAAMLAVPAAGQAIRNYDVNFTSTPPTIDGVVGAGEWDDAAAPADDWRELRDGIDEVDTDGNRFQAMYDANNLYILYQTDYATTGTDGDQWLSDFGGNPNIVFGEENLNIYIDPNRDGDLNTDADGNPLTDETANNSNVDGYQIAFNQYEGTHISTDADRDGIGFFTEGHVNSPFGDQGGWNQGGDAAAGAGLAGSGITVAQVNSNSPASGVASGVAEIVIPFADLDANAMIPGPAPNADFNGDGVQDAADFTVWRDTLGTDPGGAGNGTLDGADADDDGDIDIDDYNAWKNGFGRAVGSMIPTGLNATDEGARTGPEADEVWGFNMSMITRDGDAGDNFLPIWSFTTSGSFASWPHGTFTFQGVPAGAGTIPEPAVISLLAIGALGFVSRRQR